MPSVLVFSPDRRGSSLLDFSDWDDEPVGVAHDLEQLDALVTATPQVHLVVITPEVRDPVRVAQYLQRLQPTLGVLIFRVVDELAETNHALKFAPAIGDYVSCRVAGTPAEARREVVEQLERTRVRHRQHTILAEANRRLATSQPLVTLEAEYLDRLLDYAPVGVCALDEQGLVVEWSGTARRITGLDEDVVLGHPIFEVLPAKDGRMRQLLDAPSGSSILIEQTPRFGRRRVLECRASRSRSRQGILGFLLLFSDVTDRIEAEEQRDEALLLAEALLTREQEARAQAEQALKWRDEFLSVAAHELRTPLTSLKGYAQLAERWLQDDSPNIERLRESVGELNVQIKRFERLTTDLLDIARVQHGRLLLVRERVDLAELLTAVMDGFQHSAVRQTTHVLTTDLERDVLGNWDPIRLQQVFVNLVVNAIHYSPEGGNVSVVLRREGDSARVTVSDEGIGIEPEALTRIFQPFERATTGNAVPGTGLGLYISKQIVDLHGGSLTVESTPGEGSTFKVELPAGPFPAEASEAHRDH